MIDDRGSVVDNAGPAHPVEVLGLQGTPSAGDIINVVGDEARAREIAEYRTRQLRQTSMAAGSRGTLEQMFDKIKTGEAGELSILIKTDVQGSLEAIKSSLQKLETEEVKFRSYTVAAGRYY